MRTSTKRAVAPGNTALVKCVKHQPSLGECPQVPGSFAILKESSLLGVLASMSMGHVWKSLPCGDVRRPVGNLEKGTGWRKGGDVYKQLPEAYSLSPPFTHINTKLSLLKLQTWKNFCLIAKLGRHESKTWPAASSWQERDGFLELAHTCHVHS